MPRRVVVVERTLGPLPPGMARVRVEGCGLCGSNIPLFEGRPWFSYPLAAGAPGHEAWGVVEEVSSSGRESTDSLRLGARVAMLNEAALADRVDVAVDRLVPLPAQLNGMPFPGEAIGCAFNVFARTGIAPADTVAVVGCGFLGSLLVAIAARSGARVIAVSRRRARADVACKLGPPKRSTPVTAVAAAIGDLTGGQMCDVVIEAAGSQEALDLAAQLCGVRGRLVIAGYHQDGSRTVDMQLWNWRGLDVVNAARARRLGAPGGDQAGGGGGRLRLDRSEPLVHPPVRVGADRRGGGGSARRGGGFRQGAGDDVTASAFKPRLGFLGTGWIGRSRMEALIASGEGVAAAVCDADASLAEAVAEAVGARAVREQEILGGDLGLDGIVIATPSALHASQARLRSKLGWLSSARSL